MIVLAIAILYGRNKHAFEKLEQRKEDKESWRKALQYIDEDENNVIKQLMDLHFQSVRSRDYFVVTFL